MLLSKGRSAKLLTAAMIYVVAFASFLPACSIFDFQANAAPMEISVGPGGTPCLPHAAAESHLADNCCGQADTCLEVTWNKTEAAQVSKPAPGPGPLAATLNGDHGDHPWSYRMRRAVAASFHALPPLPGHQTPVALKTLFQI
tara:strand:+ start:128 stop:556 length:429 start_codon:yes stop_codon:yes gene_type:complete